MQAISQLLALANLPGLIIVISSHLYSWSVAIVVTGFSVQKAPHTFLNFIAN